MRRKCSAYRFEVVRGAKDQSHFSSQVLDGGFNPGLMSTRWEVLKNFGIRRVPAAALEDHVCVVEPRKTCFRAEEVLPLLFFVIFMSFVVPAVGYGSNLVIRERIAFCQPLP